VAGFVGQNLTVRRATPPADHAQRLSSGRPRMPAAWFRSHCATVAPSFPSQARVG
jgi:hypothetical protein